METASTGNWKPWLFLNGIALASLGMCGCGGFWDEVTSRDFEFRALFVKPDPLRVLSESDDGDKRAAALRALKEPKRHGGSTEEQDVVVRALSAAATADRQPLCRLAAIETLGHFQDPRVVPTLKAAFFNAASFPRLAGSSGMKDGLYGPSDPAPELITRIQCEALTALGEQGNPDAVELLVRVVREPRGEGDQENQQAMDRRIAATRALAKFKDPQAVQALAEVVKMEKDVALRDRAYEALASATGQKLPSDPKHYSDILPKGTQEAPVVQRPTDNQVQPAGLKSEK